MWTLSERAQKIRDKEQEKVNARLKAAKQDPIDDYTLDLRLLGLIPFGHPCRYEFLLRCWLHQWDGFTFEADGIQNYWAIRMAQGFCRYPRLNLMGCGSSGKTALASAYVYTAWKSRPFETSVFLSTTSGEAAQARTWGQVKDWHAQDKYPMGKRIESLHLITLDDETKDDDGNKVRDFRNSIKVVLIKPGSEGKNVMASIVGRKNDFVIWCCDEFPFMDVGILDARVNLNNNPFSQFIGLGNAPGEGDPMYQDATPFGPEFPDGWNSVNKDFHKSWKTQKGFCLYFNGADSPNFKSKSGMAFPKLMNETFRKRVMEDSGGEDNPMYWKQFYGFPPTVDVPDKIITFKLLESNGALETPVWRDLGWKTVAGLDLGFREGGDPTVIDFGRVGTEETGRKILAFEGDGTALLPKQSSKEAFETQIAKQVIEQCRKRDCHDLALDVTGDGGILLQHIERVAREEKWKLDIVAVSFSGTADDTIRTPGDKRLPTEIYANKMTQIWAQFRVCVTRRLIRGCNQHHQATKELCGRKFDTDDKKRFVLEKKKDFKKRLRHSPDRGDARCLCAFMAIKVGLSGEVLTADERKEEQQARFAEATAPDGYSSHGEVGGYSGW